MIKLVEMDEKVTVFEQMEANVDSVILINKFNVKPDEVDQFLKDLGRGCYVLYSNQDLFRHNCTVGLVEAVCSSTVLFGNPLNI